MKNSAAEQYGKGANDAWEVHVKQSGNYPEEANASNDYWEAIF
jgi:hypothetical protein